MFLFCFFGSSFTKLTSSFFIGDWYIQRDMNGTNVTEYSDIELDFKKFSWHHSLLYSDVTLFFMNTEHFEMSIPFFRCISVIFPNQRDIFIFKPNTKWMKNQTTLFLNIVENAIYQKNFTYYDLHQTILNEKNLELNSTISFSGKIEYRKTKTRIIGKEVSGTLNIWFDAVLIDQDDQKKREIVFGVFRSMHALLALFGWKSINKTFHSVALIPHLSFFSFLLLISLDFASTFYIFAFTFDHFMPYVTIFSLITEFFNYISYENVFVAKVQMINSLFRGIFSHCANVIISVLAQSLLVALFIYLIASMAQSPILITIVLYSYMVPQIIYSAIHADRKKQDPVFVVLIACTKIMQIYYFQAYHYNYVHRQFYKAANIGIVYVAAQTIILLLQNKYGARFFLPKSWRPPAYNYYGHDVPEDSICPICLSPINSDDNTVMTTPCGHHFHSSCLRRWMADERVCPFCRTPLPDD